MFEQMNGVRWWQMLMRAEPGVTDGEREIMVGSERGWQISQEQMDARRLIEIGRRTGDEETLRIGQTRLRFLLGKTTPEDMG